jgi:hypothetical protein
VDEADPLRLLYRVGRAPDPLAWPPPNLDGRYNDPHSVFRVLYAASERRAAFLETLQSYRPALRDLALLADAFPAHAPDLPFHIGRVPSQYFTKRIAAFRLDDGQHCLDVRSPRNHAFLRHTLAAELIAAGYGGAFNFGEIIGADHRVTRIIARWGCDAGYHGIAYPSAHHSNYTCWAIFDRASLLPEGHPEPIQRHDPDLIAAVDLFGLVLPEVNHERSPHTSL